MIQSTFRAIKGIFVIGRNDLASFGQIKWEGRFSCVAKPIFLVRYFIPSIFVVIPEFLLSFVFHIFQWTRTSKSHKNKIVYELQGKFNETTMKIGSQRDHNAWPLLKTQRGKLITFEIICAKSSANVCPLNPWRPTLKIKSGISLVII